MGWLRELHRCLVVWSHLPRHWRLRPGTLDRRLFRHVVLDNEYRLPGRFGPGDVVLDVGAHTGSFALAVLRRGVGRVVCCEPQPDNAHLLTRNLAPFRDRVSVLPSAVWRSDRPASLRLRPAWDSRNTGAAQALEADDGPAIRTVAFDDLVRQHAPRGGRVRLVKLDCEGAEWPILLTSRCLGQVEALCGEYHLPPLIVPPADLPPPCPELLVECLTGHGFDVTLAAAPGSSLPVGLFFAHRGVAE